jgi:hypothetical protein
MSLLIGILLKGLGFGKILLGWAWEAIKGIVSFAVEKPFQFLTVALSAALVIAGWYGLNKNEELEKTKTIVNEKVEFIKGQDKILTEYKETVKVQKETLIKTVTSHNNEVSRMKKTADAALARAKAAGLQAERKAQTYKSLAEKYKTAGDSDLPDNVRIIREQDTTDNFIADWRKAK